MSESTLQLTINGGWWQFTRPLRERLPFRTYGNLRGGPATGHESTGRLPADWARLYQTGSDYTVWSYGTPIAWHRPADDLWITPDERYSVTTSKAQGRIFTAISQLRAVAANQPADA